MSRVTFEQVLAQGRPLVYYTVGDSMQPLLYQRDTHVVVRRPDGRLKPGDIALYHRPAGSYVLHRVIRVQDGCYLIRGDNCLSMEHVPDEWVIGVVTAVFRHGREIRMTDAGYRLYVAVWNAVYPARAVWYKLRGRLRRLGRKRGRG